MAIFPADAYTPDFGLPYPRWLQDRAEVDRRLPTLEAAKDFLQKKLAWEAAAKQDPNAWAYRLESWDEVVANWAKYRNHVILGGNRCLAPEVPLWVEERKAWVPISEIGQPFTTWAWDGKRKVLAKSSAPFIKGRKQMMHVRLSGSGETFRCTPGHRILCTDGEFRQVRHIGRKYSVLAPDDSIRMDMLNSEWDLEADVWDVTVEGYENYITAGVVHHNSSKSSFAAQLVVDAAMKIPEAKIRCYHVNEEKSIGEQQAFIWAALPDRYKSLGRKKGVNFSIQYSQRNGFTGGKLILPPAPGYAKGSEVIFSNYQQYRNDAQVAEGWWAHIIWGDEEMPQQLFETLQYRLIDAKGRLVQTFTTLQGWSPLVSDIMARTKVIRRRHAPLLSREIPDAMESLSRPSTRLYFFWSQDNPFIPADDFLASLKGRPQEEILARAYGIPTKSSSSPFPGFDETVHVVPHEKLPWLCPKTDDKGNVWRPPEMTHYMVIDPSGSKPWFIIWAAVDARGAIYIYHEFPDVGYGPWAEPGKDAFGKAGSAQKQLSWGYDNYADMLKQVEGETEIFERLIDPRLGAAQVQSKEGATSIISDFEEAMHEAGFANATLRPAPGLNIDHGLSLINDRLNYDTTRPLGPLNAPRLYISDRCENLIYAFKNFTNQGGKDEPCKDPIDCVRYLLEAGADFVPASSKRATGRTFSY